MRISQVRNLNFLSNERIASKKKDPKMQYQKISDVKSGVDFFEYSNYTSFFREDLANTGSKSWGNFIGAIIDNFKDIDKVNVYDFGASDGSEAYSLIMGLIEKLGFEGAKKFFPIKAFDNDEYIVQKARNGNIEADLSDINAIKENAFKTFIEDFDLAKDPSELRYPYTISPKKHIKEQVEFNLGDFLAELDNVEPKNSLILCRNFWRYLSFEEREMALEKLDKLDSSSLVVLGYGDKTCSFIGCELEDMGFVEISNGVYKKKRV